jgi:hypothetical protein
MRRFLMALALCAGLFLVEAQAQGQFNFKPGRLEDQASIGKALAAIPFNDRTMGYRSLGERIERLGLNVARIEVERLTADDARGRPGPFPAWRHVADDQCGRGCSTGAGVMPCGSAVPACEARPALDTSGPNIQLAHQRARSLPSARIAHGE